MRIEISGKGLRDELVIATQKRQNFARATPGNVNAVSQNAMYKVKRLMPVDTGRARATWGIFSPDLLVYISTKNPVDPSESIWKVEDGGLTITQGADLRPYNYIDNLNSGSSTQAPALFLDVVAEQAADELEQMIMAAVDRLL